MVIQESLVSATRRPGDGVHTHFDLAETACPGCRTILPGPEHSFPGEVDPSTWNIHTTRCVPAAGPVTTSPEALAQLLLATLGMKLVPRLESHPGQDLPRSTPPHAAESKAKVLEEQNAFRADLRTLVVPTPDSPSTLQLCPPVVSGRVLLPTRSPLVIRPTENVRPARRPRRFLTSLVPLTLLGMLIFLGHTALNQSVTALNSAWDSTDTSVTSEAARTQSRYSLEQGIIPGPFAQMPSSWQALKAHLQPTTAPGPAAAP